MRRLGSISLVEGLRHGVVTASPIDRHSRWFYLIVTAWFVAGLPVFLAMGFTLDLGPQAAIGAGALILACWLLRYVNHQRIAGGIEVVIVGFFFGLPVMFVIYPLLAVSGPLADPWLANVDRALGFDWFAFIAFFKAHPFLMKLMVWIYLSLFWQQLLLLPALWLRGFERRAWLFVTALVVAMCITLAIYPFTPCDDAFVHYGVTQAQFPLSVTVPWTTSPVVRSVKAGARVITAASLKGIVTFPSYHAAVAAMLTWAAWPLKPLRYSFVVLNTLMIVSCIVVGAHYLIDLVVGVAIGAVAVVISKKIVCT
jgi:membrane-associated phospholipid phosphatase